MKKNLLNNLKILILGIIFSLGIGVAFAWTGPTASPTNNNAPAPLNVGSVVQAKAGDLIAGSLTTNDLLINNYGRVTISNGSIVTIAAGNPGPGKVLTAYNTSGSASWATPLSSQWTTSGSNIYYYYGSASKVGIGQTNPSQTLDVNGNIHSTGLCLGTDTCVFSIPAAQNLSPYAKLAGATFTGGVGMNSNLTVGGNLKVYGSILPTVTAQGVWTLNPHESFVIPAGVYNIVASGRGSIRIGYGTGFFVADHNTIFALVSDGFSVTVSTDAYILALAYQQF